MSETETPSAPVEDNLVRLTVDGKPVAVEKGTNVLEAAKTVGVEISAFCYHPGLSIAACCRQCLVSIDGNPKLQPSCQQGVAEGMVVHTEDARSTAARKQMLEFTLVNHPIDCPICDKAGECTLQKNYFDYDNADSRVDVPKVHKPKVVDLGPHIVLDAERCILCTRCIRVCDEVAGEHQLEMSHRGSHEELGTAPGAVLDNPYSLNTVDVCPVGALTSKDFRFTMRAWELNATPSVCTGCATGCNIEIHHKNERAWRLVPRHNAEVNAYWMCDEGRFTYHALRQSRLVTPVVDGLPASWERALDKAGAAIKAALETDSASVGVVLSAQHGNEENYLLNKLARSWKVTRVYAGGRMSVPERADDRLRDADVNPNTNGVVAIHGSVADLGALESDLIEGELSALIILGDDLPLSAEAITRLKSLDACVVVAWQETQAAKAAKVALPCAAWAETSGTVTNRQGMVQRLHGAFPAPGSALPAWEVLAKLATATGVRTEYKHTRDLFTEMVGAVAAFAGAEWGRDARPLQLRFAGSRG